MNTGYQLRADPEKDSAGAAHFYTDESGLIRMETGRPATANSPPL